LIFLIREDARSLPRASQSPEHDARQRAFRGRLGEAAVMFSRVESPADLELGLLHALEELRVESVALATFTALAWHLEARADG
jgi:hypothetical protein